MPNKQNNSIIPQAKRNFPLAKEHKTKKKEEKKAVDGDIIDDEVDDDVKSGWSSRRDSQISVEDEVLIEKL